jgi:hypothetical protein
MAAVAVSALAMAAVSMAAMAAAMVLMAVEPAPQLEEFGSIRDTRRRHRIDPTQQASAIRPGRHDTPQL